MPKPPQPSSAEPATDRGKRARFDPRTGEVSGSGADIGNPGRGEDYDSDLDAGSGAPPKPGGPSNSA